MIEFDTPKTFIEVFMEGHIVHPYQNLTLINKDGVLHTRCVSSYPSIEDNMLIFGVEAYNDYIDRIKVERGVLRRFMQNSVYGATGSPKLRTTLL